MGKAKIIAVIAVAAILVGGGVGAAFMMGAFDKETKLSFDKNYFDLKGAKGYAIAKDSIVSAANSSVSISINGQGKAVMLLGDDQNVDKDARSFYKLTDNGYVKVKMYKDANMSDEVSEEYPPLMLEMTDDGKYLFMAFGEPFNDANEWRNVTYVIVSLATGKIYELDSEGNDRVGMNVYEQYSGFMRNYNVEPLNECFAGFYFKYLGSSDKYVYLSTNPHMSSNKFHIYAVSEGNDELVMKEFFNNEKIVDIGNIKFYNGDILRILPKNTTDIKDSYLVSADAHLFKQLGNTIVDIGGYACINVTYLDPETKFFPESYDRITGITDLGLQTEHIGPLTAAQSYDAAKGMTYLKEIYRKVGDTSITVVLMTKVNTIQTVTLNSNGTSSEPEVTVLPDDFKLSTYPGLDGGRTIQDDSQSANPQGAYLVVNKHICQSDKDRVLDGVTDNLTPSTSIVSDGKMYKAIGGTLKVYDLISKTGSSVTIQGLVETTTLEVEGDTAIIEGVSSSMKDIKGSINLATGAVDVTYNDVLREIRIKALS